jgi:hypothetical protein
MSTAPLWKAVAGVAAAAGLLVSGAGIAAASTMPSRPSDDHPPAIDCATAEHAGFGMAYHMIGNDCPGKPTS